MIYLAPCADATDRTQWTWADHLRPLSPRGWRASVRLAARMAGAPITAVAASPTTSTHGEVVAALLAALRAAGCAGAAREPGSTRSRVDPRAAWPRGDGRRCARPRADPGHRLTPGARGTAGARRAGQATSRSVPFSTS
ncbi:MAG: hypothetical protein JWO79_819 [Actinomycetia bacterium]|nr:hypothetical protein [Actinomycetes bacterium]